MKVRLILCVMMLSAICAGCASDHYAGKFEADLTVDPETHQITGMHVLTTKNYGNINASGTVDPKTQMPVFTISAENVDATSLAAIVAKSNAESTGNILGMIKTVAGVAAPVIGVPIQ